MPHHRVCNKSNTTDATSGAGRSYPYGEHMSSLPGLLGFVLLNFQLFVQCFINHYGFLCLFSFLTIALSVLLRYTASNYPFDVFKLFLYQTKLPRRHLDVLSLSLSEPIQSPCKHVTIYYILFGNASFENDKNSTVLGRPKIHC